jgi:3-oxoadipate enol-lactonase
MTSTNGAATQVDLGGSTFRVAIEGKKGAPCVVLSHSIMTDLHVWDAQIEALRDRFQVLRFDTRGHGGSVANAPPYNMQTLVQDVVRILDFHHIDKAHFVGLSLGGMIGYGLALSHPDRVASLVASSSRADAPDVFRAGWDERIAAVRAGGMEALAMPTVGRWFTPEFTAAHPATCEHIAEMIKRTLVQGFEGCARALQGLDYLPEIGRIRVPALLIAGACDGTIPDDMRNIHAQIAQSRFEVIAGSGHLPNVDNAAEFNGILAGFLDQVTAAK